MVFLCVHQVAIEVTVSEIIRIKRENMLNKDITDAHQKSLVYPMQNSKKIMLKCRFFLYNHLKWIL